MENKKEEKSVHLFNQTAANYYNTYNGRHARKVTNIVYGTLTNLMEDDGMLLDVGCGTGTLIRNLASKYERWNFVGIDLSDEMLKICEKEKGERQNFYKASSENIPYEKETFQVITCTDSFHHYVQPQKALDEMYRVLQKDGYLILSEIWLPFIIRQVTNIVLKVINTGDVRVYGKKILTKMLQKAGFKEITFHVKSPMIYECIAKKV